jgi:hypothetical protein
VARFPGKKLPPHWVYVPSRREVRDLLLGLTADVRCVDFDGTGSGPSPVGLLLGQLERRVVAGAWCFYLRLLGVPESAVGAHRHELGQAAVQAIKQSVVECLVSRPSEVIKPSQLWLRFVISERGVASKCCVKPVGRYSCTPPDWWIDSHASEGDIGSGATDD